MYLTLRNAIFLPSSARSQRFDQPGRNNALLSAWSNTGRKTPSGCFHDLQPGSEPAQSVGTHTHTHTNALPYQLCIRYACMLSIQNTAGMHARKHGCTHTFSSGPSRCFVEMTSQVCPTSDWAGLGCFGSFKPAAGTRFTSGLDKSVSQGLQEAEDWKCAAPPKACFFLRHYEYAT